MASRALLHINKLNDLEKWLEKQGYMILSTSKNPYEVLRAKRDDDTVIIYCKKDSKEHLSVMDKDYSLIRRFINESKLQTNADKIRSMTDKELALAIMCPAEYDSNFNKRETCNGEMNKNCYRRLLKWLRAESEG